MKLLVCISKTPDTTSKISFSQDGKRYLDEGIQYILNPYDEWYALVRAIELKEKFGGQIDVIHVGNATSDILIRKALAIGADAAFRIDMEPMNSDEIAKQIAKFAKENSYDLIFCGKETIDHNSSEVASRIAQYLDIPYLSYCNHLEIENDKIVASCELEGGVVLLEAKIPVVISAAKGLAEQRIPNMKGIIDAKKKPLEVISPIETEQLVELVCFELPPVKSGVKMIDPTQIDEMVAVFKNELKII
ncbi:MAG TPA: electron transfer flavoprotein subunit beta/FixA family protein [Saprospiraceae bacterium]|nr:electron transfer flavoprotein subunit beta/FixA family protein [Saprospiraceae bacterium]